jgi:hypothetical protein
MERAQRMLDAKSTIYKGSFALRPPTEPQSTFNKLLNNFFLRIFSALLTWSSLLAPTLSAIGLRIEV